MVYLSSYCRIMCAGGTRPGNHSQLLFPACSLRPSSSDGGMDKEKKQKGSSIDAQGPYVSGLGSRGVIRIRGSDTFRFLQGLCTNDVYKLQQDPPSSPLPVPTPNQPAAVVQPLYTALLNPQGRFLFDLFIYNIPTLQNKLDKSGSGPGLHGDSTPVLHCDVDSSTLNEILDHFKKYKLRAKVEFEDASNNLSVWQRYGGSIRDVRSEAEDSEVQFLGWGAGTDSSAQASVEGDNHSYGWFKDPRLKVLGLRGIFPSNTTPPLVEAGKELEEVYYSLFRLEQGVPEGCTEIPKEKAIPLEYNLAWLNAISFEKGCYVGQELVARTEHRGVIRKRLVPINFFDKDGQEVEQCVVPSAEIIDVESNKRIGEVTTVLGSRGLGLIRLEAVARKNAFGIANMKDICAIINKPKWWPQNWCPREFLEEASS